MRVATGELELVATRERAKEVARLIAFAFRRARAENNLQHGVLSEIRSRVSKGVQPSRGAPCLFFVVILVLLYEYCISLLTSLLSHVTK